ncbi:MAG: GNAT family N-acetyltransferase [Nitrospiraceae bacterium]|nr:GNAT family N-acetyltransferase [Nitrospiraceae bacterium]
MKLIAPNLYSMGVQHTSAVVQLHLNSFQGFFLSFLGPSFLTIYYAALCKASEGIAIVYCNDNGIPAGFVVGSSNPRGFYSRLLKREWLRFAIASVGAMVRKPNIIVRLARAVSHPGNNPVGEDVAGLFSVGVQPDFQGCGIGKQLISAFLEEAAKRGCRRVFLTTDRDNNDAVNIFYQRCGFAIERQYETPEGRRMNEYWISINDEMNKV